MTNQELCIEIEVARVILQKKTDAFVRADRNGALTDRIENEFLEAEEDLRWLMVELNHRVNFDIRWRAW